MQGKEKGQNKNLLPFQCTPLQELCFPGSDFFFYPAACVYEQIIFIYSKMCYLKVSYNAKQIYLAYVDSAKISKLDCLDC